MHTKGFTLIELMIVVAIIGIITAIAYPSYQDSIAKSRRADAQTGLLELTQFMERHYTANGRYTEGAGDTRPALPFTESPKDGGTKFYDLSFRNEGNAAERRTRFTLQAVPKGGMLGDECGTLTLTHTGVKDKVGGTLARDQCWRN